METVFLSTDEVSRLLGTTRGNVYLLCRRGRLPFIKQGRRTLIPRPAWERFLATMTDEALAGLKEADHAQVAA